MPYHSTSTNIRRSYEDHPNYDTLKAYLTHLFEQRQVTKTVDVLTQHIEKFGLSRKLVIFAEKLYGYLKPILEKNPKVFEIRLDMMKLLVSVRNFFAAAAFLENAFELDDQIDVGHYRHWLIEKWKPFMGARRFIDPKYSIDEFFNRINKQHIRYVVLRWFEDLPNVELDEDIDFLVDDSDIDAFNEYLVPYCFDGAQKIDVYSPTGRLGTSFHDIPYYQANLAKAILQDRICYRHKYFVPSNRHHFLSLAYHAVYHKAENSGFPQRTGHDPEIVGEHDYKAILGQLCRQYNIPDPEYTLEGLHCYLHEIGWSPSIDLIRKYDFHRNGWLSSLYPKEKMFYGESGALTVFVLREKGLKKGLYSALGEILYKEGFEIIHHAVLHDEIKQRAGLLLRGGNWGKGPFPVSGGLPAAAFVAYDHIAMEPDDTTKKQHPFVNNQRSLKIKDCIRNHCNSGIAPEYHFNPLHSCDDDTEAWEYIELLFQDDKQKIAETLNSLATAFSTLVPVKQNLTEFGRRAKIELVQSRQHQFIRKTYKSNRKRFMDREIFAYGTLSKQIPYIPKLIDHGENWLHISFIKENRSYPKGELIKSNFHLVHDFLTKLMDMGYGHLDFNPNNILFSDDGKMHVIDYEFLYRYVNRPINLASSFDVSGYPLNFEGDLPAGGFEYNRHLWVSQTGHSLEYLIGQYERCSGKVG